MVFLRNLLLLSILLLVIFLLVTTAGEEPSTDQAKIFISKLQDKDLASIIPQFGDNTCHCQPRGGYRAYLVFESGENDNLAALYGHKFKATEMHERVVPTKEKFQGSSLPWEQPESTEVDVVLNFEKDIYCPLFLPLDTAYGYGLGENDLADFGKNPSNEFWRSFSLRLRPSLAKGIVAPVKANEAGRKPEFMADMYLQLLPKEESRYIRPADAGDIIDSSGKARPALEYEKLFPRLKSCVLSLQVVRRGKFQRWSIRKGRLKDPVFILSDGNELALKTPPEALVDIPGQGPQAEDGSNTEEKKNSL